jgi:hypothetical protein
MRALGPALVVAALLLSSGGVVYRRPAQAQAQQGTVQAAPTGEQETCRAQPLEPAVRRTRIAPPETTGEVVSLGTRGFNYSRPGDPVPTEIRAAGAAPAAPRD